MSAYLLWGGFPLYWPLLEPGGALEILAHRVLWSLVTMGLLLVVLGRWGHLRAAIADRRRLRLLCVAAAVITLNWATYIWGVNDGRVVETSLGYFINPLVTVALAVVVLHERLRPRQRTAIAIAAVAVAGILVLGWVAKRRVGT